MIYAFCKCHLLSFVLIFIAYCYAVSINFVLLRKTRWTFLLVNVHLIVTGITRATITPLNGVNCFWHYCRLRHLRGFGTRCAFSPHTLRYRTCVPHGTTQIIDAFLFELLRLFLHQNYLARIFCYFCSHSFTSVRLLRLRAMTEQPLAVSLRTR